MLKTPFCRKKLLKNPATQPHTQRHRHVLCFSYKKKFDQSGNRSFFSKMGRSLKSLLNMSMRVTLLCCSLLHVLETRPQILPDTQRENKVSVWEMLYIVELLKTISTFKQKAIPALTAVSYRSKTNMILTLKSAVWILCNETGRVQTDFNYSLFQ